MALFEIKNLTFTYPEQEKPSLENVSFSLEEGEFLVICGKSGCGKSTLLRHFKTALSPCGKLEGEILLEGKPLGEVSVREQAARIGYVLQSPDNQIVTDKVWHELAFGMENLGYDPGIIRLRVAEMASFFGIQNWFMKNVEELSGGQKQLLNLASVMTMQPDLLVLDEPTSQLDPLAAGDFLSILRKINGELGTTIVLIEHRLDEALTCADRVMVMEDGGILALEKPEKLAGLLKGKDMLEAMPVPMRIYAALGGSGNSPVTVQQGREWLAGLCREIPGSQQKLSMGLSVSRQAGSNEQPAGLPVERSEKWSAGQAADRSEGLTAGRRASQQAVSGKKLPGEEILSVKDVWFRYEKSGADIVRDLNLSVKKGEFFCILGGNGTGKSTSLSLISRQNRPYRGKIRIKGVPLEKISQSDLYGRILGVLPQNPQCLFVKDTLREDLWEMLRERTEKPFRTSFRAFRKHPEDSSSKQQLLERVIRQTQIGHLLDSHPYDLSGGEQQRAALAKILLLEPEILLLDEPTKGMDGFYKKKLADIFAQLKQEGKTIVMVSHDIEFCAEFADTCALFFHGQIVTSSPSREFFKGNSFYTTAANRMVRSFCPDVITAEDAVHCCRQAGLAQNERE